MRILKKSLSLLFAGLIVWGILFGYNRLSDGFSLREIRSSFQEDSLPVTSSSLTQEQREALQKILSQPFHYLGKGCQFYAFASEDGGYVLKFFKHKHLRPLTWLNEIPMTSSMRAYCNAQIEKRKERVRNLFASCKLAYEELQEETGVIFLHLDHSPVLQPHVTLIDKLGIAHTIALDEYEYVVQKKAIPVGPTLSELYVKGEEEALHMKIHQLSSLVLLRCEKGIRDRDRSFVQNVAFAGEEEKAVFIDIGQFFKDDALQTPEETKKELLRRLNGLRFWAEERNPALLSFVDQEIASINANSL